MIKKINNFLLLRKQMLATVILLLTSAGVSYASMPDEADANSVTVTQQAKLTVKGVVSNSQETIVGARDRKSVV